MALFGFTGFKFCGVVLKRTLRTPAQGFLGTITSGKPLQSRAELYTASGAPEWRLGYHMATMDGRRHQAKLPKLMALTWRGLRAAVISRLMVESASIDSAA